MNLIDKVLGLTMPEDRFTLLKFHAVPRVWERIFFLDHRQRRDITRPAEN